MTGVFQDPYASLDPRTRGQRGARAIIMSNDGFNLTPTWRSIIVVPVSTSGTQTRRGLTAVPLPSGAAGLPRGSVAVCHQVATLDRTKLSARAGVLSAGLLAAVAAGLKAALDLD